MGGNSTLAQFGSLSPILSQRWYAFSRKSSRNSGSFFLAEIMRTICSSNPLGAISDSMSVTKPYL